MLSNKKTIAVIAEKKAIQAKVARAAAARDEAIAAADAKKTAAPKRRRVTKPKAAVEIKATKSTGRYKASWRD